MGDRVVGVAVGAAKRRRHPLGGDAEDEQQLLQIRAVVLAETEGDRWRRASAQRPAAGRAVLAAERDRGRVVVQLLEGHPEALADGDHHLGEQRRTVGVEEPVQGVPDAVVRQALHLLGVDAKHPRREAVDRLVLAVDRLALDEDRAQQHPECLGVGERAAPIGAADELLEQRLQSHALEEVVDQG
jgi:hypothetical protein